MRKILFSLLVAFSISAVAAVAAPTQVPTPARTATLLYAGCIKAKLQSTREIEPTRVGIAYFVEDTDLECLIWTGVWYSTAYAKELLDDEEVLNSFSEFRLQYLQNLTNVLRKQAMRQ